jgi:hypothetical protein
MGVYPIITLPAVEIYLETAPDREHEARADALLVSRRREIALFARWLGTALDAIELYLGQQIYVGDSDAPTFGLRYGTLEQTAGQLAARLRGPDGWRLRRDEADLIAGALDGLLQLLAAERALSARKAA